eukprot:jgi/Botrbrau1/22352/Bobra.0002s0030.1
MHATSPSAHCASSSYPLRCSTMKQTANHPLGRRWWGALMWTAATAITFALILGIAYTLVGYVEYPVLGLGSGLADLSLLRNDTALDHCLVPGSGPTSPVFSGRLCDAINGGASHFNWRSRVSLPVYIIAMSGTAGWVLFMVFSGVGLVALPVDLIREFIGRPRSTIPRSEYIRQATTLGRRAKDIKEAAELLKNEERQSGRGRRWKSAYRRLNQQLTSLESEQQKLELSFPQGEDPDYAWVVTVITFYVKLLFGVVGLALTATWIAHIITYVLVYPPLSPFLNQFFIKLDSAFPLFGTVAFALYCFYLIAATIKGCTKVGLTVLIFTVHPMKPGATLMNSFLFNVALVLLSTTAAIQFCAQSFALYASGTAIQDIWGNQVSHLMGIKYLYELHVFIYCLLSFVLLSAVLLGLRGKIKWKRYSKEDAYAS